MEMINKNKTALNSLCEQYHVARLFVFGSVLTSRFREDSDLDFLVTFDVMDLAMYFDNYHSFKDGLEGLFKRKVDLVETQTLRNPILIQSIDRSKKLVYGLGARC